MSDAEVKKLEEANLALTKEVFFRFGSHDVDGIVELLHDDAHIEFYGPSEIPYAGDYKGLVECREFFTTVLSSVDIHVHVITCKDGKWLWFRDFMNTTVAYKAFTNNVA